MSRWIDAVRRQTVGWTTVGAVLAASWAIIFLALGAYEHQDEHVRILSRRIDSVASAQRSLEISERALTDSACFYGKMAALVIWRAGNPTVRAQAVPHSPRDSTALANSWCSRARWQQVAESVTARTDR